MDNIFDYINNNKEKEDKKNKKKSNLLEKLGDILINKKNEFNSKILNIKYFVNINAELDSKKFIKRIFIFNIYLNWFNSFYI